MSCAMSSLKTTTTQPEAIPPPEFSTLPLEKSHGIQSKFRRALTKFTTRDGWLGDYDYAWLCMPTLPFTRGGKRARTLPPFYALDTDLPILLALSCGLQHALAMLAGLITPPIIFASSLNLDQPTHAYMALKIFVIVRNPYFNVKIMVLTESAVLRVAKLVPTTDKRPVPR